MKLHTLPVLAATVLIATVSGFSQQADSGWYGMWEMQSAQPGPGAPTPAKMARVIISKTGWVYAGLDSAGAPLPGAIYSPNNATCIPIDTTAEYTCTYKYTDPMHAEYSLMNKGAAVMAFKCGLSPDKKILRQTTTNFQPDGKRVTTDITWAKVVAPSGQEAASGKKK